MTSVISDLCIKFGGKFLTFDTEMPTTKAAAEVLQCDESVVIKTCIIKVHQQFLGVILQGTDRIDQKKLQKLAGKFSFAKADEVLQATGYPAGGVPPFGFSGIQKVWIDQKVLSHHEIYGGGGSKNTLVKITPVMIQQINQQSNIDVQVADIREG